jgi:phage gp46-like protein
MATLWDTVWSQNKLGTVGDWVLSDQEVEIGNPGGLQHLDPLGTAIILALFTDGRLPDWMIGQEGFTVDDQKEWHGNTFGVESGEAPFTSLLWTIRRMPLTEQTARMAVHFAAEALQPLVVNGWVGAFTITHEIDKAAGKLTLYIKTEDPGGKTFTADLFTLQ